MLRFLGWSSRSCCPFRLVPVPLSLLLVVGYQGLEGRSQTGDLPLVVLTPCRSHLLAPARVVAPDRGFPGLFALIGVPVSLPGPALDHGVELLLGRLRVLYGIHQAPFTSFASLGEV